MLGDYILRQPKGCLFIFFEKIYRIINFFAPLLYRGKKEKEEIHYAAKK